MAELPNITGPRQIGRSNRAIVSDRSGEILGNTVADVGREVSRVASIRRAEDERRQDEADRYTIGMERIGLARAKVAWDEETSEDRDHATLEQRYRERMQKAVGDAASRIRNPRDRQLFTEEAKLDVEDGALRVRARARGIETDTARADIDSTLAAARTAALDGPDDAAETIIGNIDTVLAGAVDKGYITAQERTSKRQAWVSDFALGRLETMPPSERIEALKNPDKGPARFLDADIRARLLRSAESEVATNLTEQRQAMADRLRDIGAAAQAGIPITELPDEATLKVLFGDREGSQRYRAAQTAAKLSETVAGMHSLSTTDLIRQVQSYEPTEVSGAADQAQLAGFVASRTDAILKERQADSAGYLATYSPAVRDEWALLQSDPETSPEAYLRALRAERERLQIPGDDVVPEAYAQSIADTVTSAKAEDLATTFESLASQWGSAWPQLYGQIAPDVPDMALVIGAGIPRSAAVALASTARLKDTELKGMLPPNVKWSDVETEVAAELAGFASSLPVDAARTHSAVSDAAKRLAVKYMNEGSSMGDAVEKARRDLVDSQYSLVEFRGSTIRVPAGMDPDSVEDAARAALDAYRPAPGSLVDVPTDSAMTQEDYQSRFMAHVQDNGYWLTNPASTGIRLYVDGGPVAGAPDVLWDELAASGVAIAEAEAERKRQAEELLRPGLGTGRFE